MIEVKNLTKRFGRFCAVDNLSFTVEPGEIVGFLGPNGAGKTTTMRILSGYKVATAGTVTIAGFDILRDALKVRQHVGYLPESVPLYAEMRVKEYLRYRGLLKGLNGKLLRHRLGEVTEACGLKDVERKLVGRLSKGFRQRVGLADTLIADPDVVILDEPMIGLDPNQIRMIRELIKGLGGNHSVLLSSHILTEIESICDRVLIIDHGRIVASDTPSNLTNRLGKNAKVIAEIGGDKDDISAAIKEIDGVDNVVVDVQGEWNVFTCTCVEDESNVRAEIFKLVGKREWSMRELRSESCCLEDVFVDIISTPKLETVAGEGE
ncbi:MAG: ATP-binding cassette domain-containing protein [Kiritimatiellae bacterium]|nr:ATP-binding cassette domain-containing protein [Kiritimatiellia bacterium]